MTPIEILDEMIDEFKLNNGNWNADHIINLAKERIQKECSHDVPTHMNMQWIPVEVRLPEEMEY